MSKQSFVVDHTQMPACTVFFDTPASGGQNKKESFPGHFPFFAEIRGLFGGCALDERGTKPLYSSMHGHECIYQRWRDKGKRSRGIRKIKRLVFHSLLSKLG